MDRFAEDLKNNNKNNNMKTLNLMKASKDVGKILAERGMTALRSAVLDRFPENLQSLTKALKRLVRSFQERVRTLPQWVLTALQSAKRSLVARDISARRVAFLTFVSVAALVPVWAAGRLMVAMTATPPVVEANALKSAVQVARRGQVRLYAPVDMAVADSAAQHALTAYYRAVASTTGFLRYESVERNLFDAHDKVLVACSRARTRIDKARGNAAGVIHDGRAGIIAAEVSLRSAPIGAAVRANLARARVAIGTAERRWRGGDYTEATRLATFAKTTSEDIRRKAGHFLQTYTTSSAAQRWQRWVKDTIVLSRRTGSYAVLVDKLRHKCLLYRAGHLVKSYDIDLGGPLWDKMHAGDRATPEGMYRIVRKRPRGDTIYYKALLINYPNEEDRVQFAMAKQRGWISRRAGIGGLIEIHGEGGRKEDWTLGCVALANRDIDELFQLVNVGTPVTIVGTISKATSVSG